jgi:hypothetical protein
MKAWGLFLLMVSSLAFAGDKGNGGYSIVCRDSAGTITSAELLDIYEGRILYKRNFAVDQNSVQDLIDVATSRLGEWGLFADKLQKEIALIEQNSIYIPAGNELEPTDDAFPPIKKVGCKFEQLANYTNSGEVLISQEIFDRLDNVNKAAMFIHEAVYSIRRKALGETTSQISRKLVAHLISINPDKAIIDRWVSDSLYRSNNNRPCGFEGTLEERIESCSFIQRSRFGISLVTRKSDLTEVWYDPAAKLLWSDRLPQSMDYKRAQVACPSLNAVYADLGILDWRLPTGDEYSHYGEWLSQVLPNMGGYWFWTSTTKGRMTMIYTGETGTLSYSPFTGSNTGSVRCVAKTL